MNNSAGKVIPIHSNNHSTINIKTGFVVSIIPGEIIINIQGEKIKAKKAFSCIVDPKPDDIVILTETENRTAYVLGIIERPGSQKMSVSFPSDTHIQINRGSLNINSSAGVTIASENMNCFSKRVIHKSNEAVISYDNMTASGDELQASFKTVRLISNLINTMAKQVIDKFKGYIRSTDDNDMVKAGQMTRRADGLFSMDSENTIMDSRKSTKIDGKKIFMG